MLNGISHRFRNTDIAIITTKELLSALILLRQLNTSHRNKGMIKRRQSLVRSVEPFTCSYAGDDGTVGLGVASIRCRSEIIYRSPKISALLTHRLRPCLESFK